MNAVPVPGRRYDVLAMGRSSLDLYAQEVGRPITEVTAFNAYVGGCPTNVSVGTRRLGLRSAVLTAVGDDQAGDFVLHFLDREGVDTRYVPRKPGRRTSLVLLTIQPPDRFPLTFYRDNCADRELSVADVGRAPVADCRAVFLTGTGLSHQPGREATLHAAESARRHGALVVVDLDYRPDQWPAADAFAGEMTRLLAGADIVIGTEEEAAAATGRTDPAAMVAALAASGPRTVVVKRGARGSTIVEGSRTEDVPPFPVQVLNVLGAGDAFASGFLFALLGGLPAREAARMGNAVGAIVVTRHECANFMPTLPEVEAFVRQQGGWTWPWTSA
ncbi:MAG: 5-dehydro-2-deoxygluconokinase [Vicinamibacterales bacterium]